MPHRRQDRIWTTSGLRTRYFPKSRIGHGLVTVAPWVNIVLLVILFALLDYRLVLQPGFSLDLPDGPQEEGARFGLVAVVMSVPGTGGRPREEIVFFDDERFLVRRDDQMRQLKDALAARVGGEKDANLVIQADRKVQHGTVIEIANMAADVGVKKVNMATRPF